MTQSPQDGSWLQALTESWPFSSIPEDTLKKLASRMSERHFPTGATLIRQGEPGDSLMLVLQGGVEVSVRGKDGKRRRIARIGEREVVGEMALVTKEPRLADVTAVTPVRVLVLPQEAFDELAREAPLLALVFSEVVQKRLGERSIDGMFSKRLGGYLVQNPLGRGGMGVVYRAENIETGSVYALKMMHHYLMYDPKGCSRFHREEKVIRSLHHENIVSVYDIFPAFRTYFIVMELCEGANLSEICLRSSPLPEDQARKILGQLALAVNHAHGRGIIHRDLKPANVMVSLEGVVKLMDFGLAKPVIDKTLTSAKVVLGTPAYMSPEQRTGETADERSDIYSFGLIAYELLAGSRYSSQMSTVEYVFESELGISPHPDQIRKPISAAMYSLLERCLEKRPENRKVNLKRIGKWAGPVDTALLSGPAISSEGQDPSPPSGNTVTEKVDPRES